MKKPAVDYRTLRLSNLNSPQFSHLKLLLGWLIYFIFYFLTENLIPAAQCHPIHCPLDDVIPFCEWFILPYVGWYLLIVGSLLYFLLYHVEQFKRLQTYIIITQAVAMAIYILFPSRQDLRPVVFPRDNILTDLVALIYSVDTNTGVCPSLHVAYSLGIASTWLRERTASVPFKIFVVAAVICICASVVFVKQHSVLDILAALPVCLLAEGLVFWLPNWRKHRRIKEEL